MAEGRPHDPALAGGAASLDFTFLGTGCPVATPDRRGPAHLVRSARTAVLIDCGSGVAQQLAAAGQSAATLDALVVTHYHSDHLVDFYTLVQSAWHQGRGAPFRLVAPAPVLHHARAQLAAWADERRLRIAYERRPNGSSVFDVMMTELVPWQALTIGALMITPVPVDHRPVEPAFGLHVTDGAHSLVFSGDTAPCDTLAEAAEGVDLLVHEVFLHREMPPVPGLRSQATVDAVRRYHTRPGDVADLATRTRVGCLALTHFVPPAFDRQALLADIR